MKSKLFLILTTISISVLGQSVPNTNTFSLQDVYNAVKYHEPSTQGNLQNCFANSVDAYFDVNYKGSKDRLSNFRNYNTQNTTIPCNQTASYEGGAAYPTTKTITLSNSPGSVDVHYNMFDAPDRIIVYGKTTGTIYFDSGYRSDIASSYDYGSGGRSVFNSYLNGKTIPLVGGTYPNIVLYPDDGYPRVFQRSSPYTFTKSVLDSEVVVLMYAPLPSTVWEFFIGCPY